MNIKDYGGPAFPCLPQVLADGKCGLSLRDYFAAAALQGLGDWSPWIDNGENQAAPLADARCLLARAELAYAQADAMLRARKESGHE